MENKRAFAGIVVLIIILASAFLAYTVNYGATANPLSIDGTAVSQARGVTSVSATLTTSKSSDLILVYGASGKRNAELTISDTAVLSWKTRAAVEGNRTLNEFYAIAKNPLSSDIITVSGSGSTQALDILAFAVSGVDTKSPFDGSSTLPMNATGVSNNPSVLISTSSKGAAMVVGGVVVNSSLTATAGSGFTMVTAPGSAAPVIAAQYEKVTGSQSGLADGFSLSGSNTWAMIGDVVKAASSTTTSTTSGSLTTNTSTSNQTQTETTNSSTTNPVIQALSYIGSTIGVDNWTSMLLLLIVIVVIVSTSVAYIKLRRK